MLSTQEYQKNESLFLEIFPTIKHVLAFLMYILHSIFLRFNKFILSDTYYMRNVLHKSTTNILEVYI